jgi:cytochrome c
MKTRTYGAWALAGAVALTAAPTFAQTTSAGLELARQENCTSCHAVNRQLMGPALQDVAARYAAMPDAAKYLARKITEGSSGVWGVVPMPANTQLTADEAGTLASWILTLNK